MTSTLLNKGTNTDSVKSKMDQSNVPTDPTKEELTSFLNFSRENLSVSHSEIEQGFNKSRPRIRRDTILSLIAIFLALFCIALEIWKIQSTVDNAREIELLKREVGSMKHRLLEQDLLNELKAFEEMYAEEYSEDDSKDESNESNADYDSIYDEQDDDNNPDEDSSLSSQKNHTSGFADAVAMNYDYGPKDLSTTLNTADMKIAVHQSRDMELDRIPHKEKLTHHKPPENLVEGDEADAEEYTAEPDETVLIKRKRSVDRKQLIAHNSSEAPTNAYGYLSKNKKNSTQKSGGAKLKLYDSLMEKVTTEENDRKPLIHHAVMTSWDKHPRKKYYAQSRPATTHVTRVYDRQVGAQRLRGWRDEGPQALTRKETTVHRRDESASKAVRVTRPLTRHGMTRRHLRGGRQIVAAHYGADSSLFADGDEHIGNGKGRHYEGVFKAWRPSSWMGDLGMSRYFTLPTDGKLTVQEPGLYLIYAQIHYLDEHDENGFQVLVNDRSILQCMVYSPGMEHKSRSCFSAQATLLQSGDRLLLKDVAMDRYTLFQHDKSFFGLVRLGDTRSLRSQSPNQQ